MRYPIPAGRHRIEEEIQRSRFITTLAAAPTVEAARIFVDTIRDEFSGATHHCWAFLVGPPGSSGHVGMSDDGEPHGTAGRPMLNVLTHAGVGDIVAVVTRYYGGTKLGKGGLARAYSSGVQTAMASLPTREKVSYLEANILLDYDLIDPFRRLIGSFETTIEDERYDERAAFRVAVPEDVCESFLKRLESVTHGRAVIAVDKTKKYDA